MKNYKWVSLLLILILLLSACTTPAETTSKGTDPAAPASESTSGKETELSTTEPVSESEKETSPSESEEVKPSFTLETEEIDGRIYYFSNDPTRRNLFHFSDSSELPQDKILTFEEALALTEGKRLEFTEREDLIDINDEEAYQELKTLVSVYFTLWENGEYWNYCDFTERAVTEKWAERYSRWSIGPAPFASVYMRGKWAGYAPDNTLKQVLYMDSQEAYVIADSLMQEHFLYLGKEEGKWKIMEDIARTDAYSVDCSEEDLRTVEGMFVHIRELLTEDASEAFTEENAKAALSAYLAENPHSLKDPFFEILPYDEAWAMPYFVEYILHSPALSFEHPYYVFFVRQEAGCLSGYPEEGFTGDAYYVEYDGENWQIMWLVSQ